jgi:hypothetical protein
MIVIYSIVLALSACDGREASIPVDQGSGFRDGYVMQVSRAGSIEWNGPKLADPEFERYVRQISAMPKGAGLL